MSEKLDGVRVFWDPKAKAADAGGGKGVMMSRLGNAFMAPKEMIASTSILLHFVLSLCSRCNVMLTSHGVS